jgi:2-methylcitrate dehydratase PrpD
VDPNAKTYLEARVRIVLRDGTLLDRHVPHALGTLARPMSDSDLEAKFRDLVAPVLPDGRTEDLIRLCWNVEDLPDIGAIARAASVSP